jgi:signal transduction histidine kinase
VLCGEARSERPSDAALNEFLSHISHELKSPLNTIRSYSEMLMDGSIDDPETRKEFFNVINEESCRLAKLIENLLDLSKLDAGTLRLQKARLRPEALLGELVRAAEAQARAGGVVLEAKFAANLPTVFADKDLVAVALNNLLSNALKYTPQGGRVTVRARGEVEALVLEVADTGIGIPVEEQAHIFEKFYRGSSAEVRRRPGTGLGLALAQQIVSLHGGQLTLTSQPGRGTTFRLQLPAGAREQREAFGLPEAT